MSRPKYKMEPGYAYKRVRGQWQTVMIGQDVADRALYEGTLNIDGSAMAVFTMSKSVGTFGRRKIVTYAQLLQNVRKADRHRHGSRLRNPRAPRKSPKQTRAEAEERLHKYLISRGATASESAKEIRRLKGYSWASFANAAKRLLRRFDRRSSRRG